MRQCQGLKIVIACPSYKRPSVKSFALFGDLLSVYVDEGEAKAYREANSKFASCIVSVPKGVQGNVARIRNYILDDCLVKQGADVVCICDDDMNSIGRFAGGHERTKLRQDEILPFIARYTHLCREFGFRMWGVNLNADKQCYREYTPFSTTSVVLGPFSCFLQGNTCRYDVALPLKEDYDMSIQNLNKYRGILRVNAYNYICEQSTNVGGCAAMRNIEREKSQLKALQRKWGSDIVKFDTGDKCHKSQKVRTKTVDYNPIIHIPIKGV